MNRKMLVLSVLVLIVLLCASCTETSAPAALPTTAPLPSPTISPTQDCFLDIEVSILDSCLEETVDVEIGGKAGLELEYDIFAVSVTIEVGSHQVDITGCLIPKGREEKCEKKSIKENEGLLGKIIKMTVSIRGEEKARVYLRVVLPSDLPSA